MAIKTFVAKVALALLGSLVILALWESPGVSKIAIVPACRSEQLLTAAYGAGVATGTQYLAIAITNKGLTPCRVGSGIQLMHTESGVLKTLQARTGAPLLGERINVLRSRQRGTALITTTWAAGDDRNVDCPK